MKILLIGSGAVGSVLTRLLCRDRAVDSVTVATHDIAAARRALTSHPKLHARAVDASSVKDVVRVAKGKDLIINAALPDFNRPIMRAALTVGANYQDLCSRLEDCKNPEQLKFDAEFRRKGLAALMNTGLSPGATNLLIREAADMLDDVDDVSIRVLQEQQADEMRFSWSPAVTLDELTSSPLVYRAGRFGFVKPFSNRGTYDFGTGIGNVDVVATYGDEVSTVPRFLRIRSMDYKSGGNEIEEAERLYRAGAIDVRRGRVDGKTVRVPDADEMRRLIRDGEVKDARLVMAVETSGMRDGSPVSVKYVVRCPTLKEIMRRCPGATYVAYPTAVAAAAFARVIPQIRKPGVWPPETLEKPLRDQVVQKLRQGGIRIEKLAMSN